MTYHAYVYVYYVLTWVWMQDDAVDVFVFVYHITLSKWLQGLTGEILAREKINKKWRMIRASIHPKHEKWDQWNGSRLMYDW